MVRSASATLVLAAVLAGPPLAAQRVSEGLQALYTFDDSSGEVIKDRSGAAPPIDLRISDPESVRRSKGTLEIRDKTLVRSEEPARRLAEAVKRSGAITIEAWIKPANTSQGGPARIVSLSRDSQNRNFTLGQEGDKFDLRFRSTGTSTNGVPSLASKSRSLATKLTHVAYTRERSGRARLYLDGRQVAENADDGNTGNWDPSHSLLLGNEATRGRPWLGSYHLVAIYSRSLSPGEIGGHFKAGASAAPGTVTNRSTDANASHFETKVAPILANHCIECHEPANRKGKLDLTRKDTAFAALKSGTPVVPGKPEGSLLWEAVFHDDMPEDNPPLNAEQKADLKQWIADGATWSLDRIDPANYLHSSGSSGKQWVQRLTVDEYIATVQATVGVDITAEARRILPPDLRADGFANTAYNLNVDLKHVDAYARLAEIIVARMDLEEFAGRFTKDRRFTDRDMEALVQPMGTWILRGPLNKREINSYRSISTAVASVSGSFDEAASLIVQAMLQSPRFIYRIENQRGDGGTWPVGDHELATRLSYIIWGASPDEELGKAARNGDLADARKFAAQIQRMLRDPRAIDRSVQFLDQWLHLGRLANLQPDPQKFPHWGPDLADDMREETTRFFKEIVWEEQRPLADLLNAQLTYLTPRLAAHYSGTSEGPLPRGPQDPERHDLTTNPSRGGLLTHGSVLTMGGDDASMVTRGLFVMHNLLRGVVKDPPPGTDTTPVPPRPGLSHRGAAQERITDKSCGACHKKFEPLAFALEKYDGLGAFHTQDRHGNTLREDGEVLFPGDSKPIAFETAAELMDLLASSDRVKESLTWKVTQFSLGRPPGAADAPLMQQIHQDAQKNGGTWTALLTAIVHSDLVRMTRTESAN